MEKEARLPHYFWNNSGDAVAVLYLITEFQVFTDALPVVEEICIELVRVSISELCYTALTSSNDI